LERRCPRKSRRRAGRLSRAREPRRVFDRGVPDTRDRDWQSLQQPQLFLVRDREDADDDPRVRRDEVKLLGRAEEEVEVLLQKFVEVLLPDLRKRL
jgi:hypothetical protein